MYCLQTFTFVSSIDVPDVFSRNGLHLRAQAILKFHRIQSDNFL